MANDNNIKVFTAIDIEKYHKGLLSARERHALEKAALDDPFLADALEGYAITQVNADADITELKKRLAAKTGSAKVIPINTAGKPFPWLRIAIVVILIAGAGLLSYQFQFRNKPDKDLAVSKSKNEEVKNKDSVTKNLIPLQGNTDTITVSSENDIAANVPAGSDKTIDKSEGFSKETNQNRKIEQDTLNNFLAIETALPKKNTEETKKDNNNKPLTSEAASPKGDIALSDDKNSKEIKSKKPEDKDADGVADKFAGNTKLNEVAVNTQKQEAFSQQIYRNPTIFRGRVTDANNNALPFVNVTNTRDNVGTYTDARGNFTLVSTDTSLNVQVRSLGFENNTVQLRGGVPENKILMLEDRSLPERILDSSKRNLARRYRNGNMTFEEPEPADGWGPYDSYLANNVNIPANFDKKQTSGSNVVEVSFEVNKNGEPVNIKVEKSLCEKCDKEAIRLIKEGPKWKRKARKGRATVAVPFSQ